MDTRAILKYEKNSVCQRTDYILQVQIQFLQLHKSVASFQDRTGINTKCQYLFFFIPFKGPLKKKRIEGLEGKGLDRKGRVKKRKTQINVIMIKELL